MTYPAASCGVSDARPKRVRSNRLEMTSRGEMVEIDGAGPGPTVSVRQQNSGWNLPNGRSDRSNGYLTKRTRTRSPGGNLPLASFTARPIFFECGELAVDLFPGENFFLDENGLDADHSALVIAEIAILLGVHLFAHAAHLVGAFDAARAQRLVQCVGDDFPIRKHMLGWIDRPAPGRPPTS